MINYNRFVLDNGLTVLVHEDTATPIAAFNMLYNVGPRDENPERTGFAHLFEHLMFGGSANIKDFDDPLQLAGGESNAFTNNDVTNFYQTLPAQNIETAFWLESDRMKQLAFSKKSLEVQRKVVLEEFSETTLNTPYGDVWHELMDLAYKKHPYRWPTIGKVPQHVRDATLEDVKSFFYAHYRPNNAVLTVAGNVKTENIKLLAEKWFGDIEKGEIIPRNLPKEPIQTERRFKEKAADVPVDALYMAFVMPARLEEGYYTCDLISDILSNGTSSRLYRRLVKDAQIFSEIDAYITEAFDAGLFIIEGKPVAGVSLEAAEAAVWAVLNDFLANGVAADELQKVKNKSESSLIFSEMGVLNIAINLSFAELLGNPELVNQEAAMYQKITAEDIAAHCQKMFRADGVSVLYYKAKETVAA